MLDGLTPVPPDFAARYRERGYWEDRPLFEGFTGALATYAERTALVDEALEENPEEVIRSFKQEGGE